MESKREEDPTSMCWTNERHMDYLNSMEDSFVQTMLENSGSSLRLDRYVPDGSDSTLDSNSERRRRRHSTSDILIPYPKARTDMKTRRPSSQPHTSQDQVVPQLARNGSSNNGRRGHAYICSLPWVAPTANR